MIRIQIHLSHPNGPMLPTKKDTREVFRNLKWKTHVENDAENDEV